MKSLRVFPAAGVLAAVFLSAAIGPREVRADFVVPPSGETAPFDNAESADDATVWLHPSDPAQSVIIGTNKSFTQTERGLYVYDLDGTLLSSVTGKQHNNVDLRYGFEFGGETLDLLAATNRTDRTIDFFTVDPLTRSLTAAGSIPSEMATAPMGIALFNDRQNGNFYAFASDNRGAIRQFELSDQDGTVGGALVRSWDVGSLSEGLVVDDLRGGLFVGEEDVGIWRYDADPAAGTEPEDRVAVGHGAEEVIAGDIEGLTLFPVVDPGNRQGYLLASEQSNNSFAVLERYDHDADGNLFEYVGRFSIAEGNGIDGASDTDGIGALSTGLSGAFPAGVFVAQDGLDDVGRQNYKLVSWRDAVGAAAIDSPRLTLATDPDYDPRDPTPEAAWMFSTAAGNWNATGTWDHGTRAPTAIDDVVVSEFPVTLTADGRALNLGIEDGGGRMTVNPGTLLEVGDAIELDGGVLDLRGTARASIGRMAAGTLDIAPAGRLEINRRFTMVDGSQYVCQIDASGNGMVLVTGNVSLGGKLSLELAEGGELPTAPGTTRRTLLVAFGTGGITDTFTEEPPIHVPGAGPEGHLGFGVFHRGLDYARGGADDRVVAVSADLYVAGGGDGNGDGNVDGQDITKLIINFSRPGDPADRTWTENDTAGGPAGRGDGIVDGQDITDLITHFPNGDPGPQQPGLGGPGSAAAAYDPATGRFRVFVDGVMSWTLTSDGQFTGSDLAGVVDQLPLGDPANLVSANANTIGEGLPGATPFNYRDVDLGQLAAPGTDVGHFSLRYVSAFGEEVRTGAIVVVPEPSSVMLVLLGSLALSVTWIARRHLTRR